MTSAWLLPEHIADVLPAEARRIEELRRTLLDAARSHGYELVMPPLLEHVESLLTGADSALDLRTFKLVDQLSGRMVGVRADTTPQVARIDAHLLNRAGLTRLCYCGPVLHARPAAPHATREPLQFGAELYGHAGIEADLEVLDLALDSLQQVGVQQPVLDLADARIVRGLLAGALLDTTRLEALYAALAAKNAAELHALTEPLAAEQRDGLRALLTLYGDDEVLAAARQLLPARPLIDAALRDLAQLAAHARAAHPQLRVGFDLSDLSGYAYYSGARFALYAQGASDALLRGGRYDEVGAAFGRNRPAVGFSTDLKLLVQHVRGNGRRAAVLAPWGEGGALREAVHGLRQQGETVVCVLPGHEHQVDEFDCDRELALIGEQWLVRPR